MLEDCRGSIDYFMLEFLFRYFTSFSPDDVSNASLFYVSFAGLGLKRAGLSLGLGHGTEGLGLGPGLEVAGLGLVTELQLFLTMVQHWTLLPRVTTEVPNVINDVNFFVLLYTSNFMFKVICIHCNCK